MRFLGSQRMETDRLILRQVELSDVPTMFENWQSDNRVTKHLSWETYPNVEHSYKVAERWVNGYNNLDFFLWLIVEKETNTPIGTIGVGDYGVNWEYAEVGYCLGYDWWYKGYAVEALTAVVKFLMYKVGIPEIFCCCDRNNKPSARVIQKAGFDFRKTKMDYQLRDDYICDVLIFSIRKKSIFER